MMIKTIFFSSIDLLRLQLEPRLAMTLKGWSGYRPRGSYISRMPVQRWIWPNPKCLSSSIYEDTRTFSYFPNSSWYTAPSPKSVPQCGSGYFSPCTDIRSSSTPNWTNRTFSLIASSRSYPNCHRKQRKRHSTTTRASSSFGIRTQESFRHIATNSSLLTILRSQFKEM